MKKIVLICVAGSAVALAACTTPGFLLGGATPFNPQHPQVYVVKGSHALYLVVDQEPIVFPAYKGKVKIKWKLRDSDYEFDRVEGIKPDPKPLSGARNAIGVCMPEGTDGSEFSCENDTAVPGVFKYSITARPKKGGVPIKLDPTIANG